MRLSVALSCCQQWSLFNSGSMGPPGHCHDNCCSNLWKYSQDYLEVLIRHCKCSLIHRSQLQNSHKAPTKYASRSFLGVRRIAVSVPHSAFVWWGLVEMVSLLCAVFCQLSCLLDHWIDLKCVDYWFFLSYLFCYSKMNYFQAWHDGSHPYSQDLGGFGKGIEWVLSQPAIWMSYRLTWGTVRPWVKTPKTRTPTHFSCII